MNTRTALQADAVAGRSRNGRPGLSAVSRRVLRGMVAAVLLAAAIAPGAAAQGSKRLAAAPPSDQPWSGCADLEGFVADHTGQTTVQSARCSDGARIWLLRREQADLGGADRAQVLDQLAVRALRPGETLSAGPYCRIRGREVRWVAIYEWKGRKRLSGHSGGIREAWVPNLQAGRIEPASRSLIRAATCTANPDE